MCEFIQVQEFCPCPADAKCRRKNEGIETPFGLRHLMNQASLLTIVCKQRRFIMSSAAFASRECPNTSEASRVGPGGDGCAFQPSDRLCPLCADFCDIPRFNCEPVTHK